MLTITKELVKNGHNVTYLLENWDYEAVKNKADFSGHNIIINYHHQPVKERQEYIKNKIDEYSELLDNPLKSGRLFYTTTAQWCRETLIFGDTWQQIKDLHVDLVLGDFV